MINIVTTTAEINFFLVYVPFLFVVLLLSFNAGANLIDGLTENDIETLQDTNPLTVFNKLGILISVSSTFFVLSSILLLMTIIAGIIIANWLKDLIPFT